MRYFETLTVAMSVALLVLGCTPSSPDSKAKMDEAKKKISGAADATAEAAKAKRDDYVREMHIRLNELDVKYEDLKGRAAKAGDQAKKDLDKKIEQTKVKRDAAARKLDELKDAGAERWEKVKDAVGNAFDDLKKAID